jgi:hypothetical protein
LNVHGLPVEAFVLAFYMGCLFLSTPNFPFLYMSIIFHDVKSKKLDACKSVNADALTTSQNEGLCVWSGDAGVSLSKKAVCQNSTQCCLLRTSF